MSIFKCKMCGGTLEISNETVITCDYCGTRQTLPKLDDERRTNLYDRANHFRRNNEFDKAMSIYEQILNEDKTDAEAYWSIVLCRYGIEYVEDPSTRKRVPTVNRAQFTSVFMDENYKAAITYADAVQKSVYEEEAKAIDEIQKGILAISEKEEPFDVFICYKETDNSGRRTPDSVLANDLYHQLTAEGFKVFFSRITLEDKLGTAYEPYIFAALNSSKVMVVLGTKPEYFSAVWVKNEWSRYLSLIKNGSRKILIPAYKDMDPYDLPEEFSHLQAQDMSKLGFMQDLIRGIKKITQADKPEAQVKETVVVNNTGSANTSALLERAFMFLEDGQWESADEYCEKVLDMEPKNARAYLGKLMAELRVSAEENLPERHGGFERYDNYKKAVRFGDEAFIKTLTEYNNRSVYNAALKDLEKARDISDFENVKKIFLSLGDFSDSAIKVDECDRMIAETKNRIAEANKKELEDRRKSMYNTAVRDMNSGSIARVERAINAFEAIINWENSRELIEKCHEILAELKIQHEAEVKEKDYQSAIQFAKSCDSSQSFREATGKFDNMSGYKDADKYAELCRENSKKIDEAYSEYTARYKNIIDREEEIKSKASEVIEKYLRPAATQKKRFPDFENPEVLLKEYRAWQKAISVIIIMGISSLVIPLLSVALMLLVGMEEIIFFIANAILVLVGVALIKFGSSLKKENNKVIEDYIAYLKMPVFDYKEHIKTIQ